MSEMKKETEKKAAADTTALKQEKTAAKAAIKKQPENKIGRASCRERV